jgi:hypothetical protein
MCKSIGIATQMALLAFLCSCSPVDYIPTGGAEQNKNLNQGGGETAGVNGSSSQIIKVKDNPELSNSCTKPEVIISGRSIDFFSLGMNLIEINNSGLSGKVGTTEIRPWDLIYNDQIRLLFNESRKVAMIQWVAPDGTKVCVGINGRNVMIDASREVLRDLQHELGTCGDIRAGTGSSILCEQGTLLVVNGRDGYRLIVGSEEQSPLLGRGIPPICEISEKLRQPGDYNYCERSE